MLSKIKGPDPPLARSKCKALRLTRRAFPLLPRCPQDRNRIRPGLRAELRAGARGERDWPFLLWGDTGRGKTTAAICLANLVEGSHYLTMQTATDLIYQLDNPDWVRWREATLLVVDELGLLGTVSDREKLAAETLAEARLWLPTIWITNHNPDGWLKIHYGSRLHSRWTCGTVLEVGGPDMRRGEG